MNNNILRDVVLPDILGNDTKEILYWEGKKLFTNFLDEIQNEEELINFFENSGFGQLEVKKAATKYFEFILSGDIVISRLQAEHPEFDLETGFLCEFVQTITNSYCISSINLKSKSVVISIDIDHKSEVK